MDKQTIINDMMTVIIGDKTPKKVNGLLISKCIIIGDKPIKV